MYRIVYLFVCHTNNLSGMVIHCLEIHIQSTLADAFLAELDELEEEDNVENYQNNQVEILPDNADDDRMEEEGDSEDEDSGDDEKVIYLFI